MDEEAAAAGPMLYCRPGVTDSPAFDSAALMMLAVCTDCSPSFITSHLAFFDVLSLLEKRADRGLAIGDYDKSLFSSTVGTLPHVRRCAAPPRPYSRPPPLARPQGIQEQQSTTGVIGQAATALGGSSCKRPRPTWSGKFFSSCSETCVRARVVPSGEVQETGIKGWHPQGAAHGDAKQAWL